MTWGAQIRQQILALVNPSQIVEDADSIVSEIEASFVFSGSKIDWNKTQGHRQYYLGRDCPNEFNAITDFIRAFNIDKTIEASDSLVYINDSSIDFAVKLKPAQFYPFLQLALNNIPQHHYFFAQKEKWCLVISMEGDVDFAYAAFPISGKSTINKILCDTQ